MALPDDDPLNKINKSCAYCDEKSLEKYTGKIKRKYKLAGNPIVGHYLDKYIFHVLTHVRDACKPSVTLSISKDDWENRVNGRYLQEEVSYCDLRKYDIFTGEELLEKIADKKNGFEYVAQLCATKCGELRQVNLRYQRIHDIPEEIRGIVGASLDDDILNTILQRLGLK